METEQKKELTLKEKYITAIEFATQLKRIIGDGNFHSIGWIAARVQKQMPIKILQQNITFISSFGLVQWDNSIVKQIRMELNPVENLKKIEEVRKYYEEEIQENEKYINAVKEYIEETKKENPE